MAFPQGFLTAGGTGGSSSKSRTTSIICQFSSAGYTAANISGDSGAIAALSGALTAGALKSIINVNNSAGRMSYFAVTTVDATARTLRLKITIDGLAAMYDVTSASISSASAGVCLAGKARPEASGYINSQPNIIWTNSIKIEIASSVTETDKFNIYYLYNTES